MRIRNLSSAFSRSFSSRGTNLLLRVRPERYSISNLSRLFLKATIWAVRLRTQLTTRTTIRSMLLAHKLDMRLHQEEEARKSLSWDWWVHKAPAVDSAKCSTLPSNHPFKWKVVGLVRMHQWSHLVKWNLSRVSLDSQKRRKYTTQGNLLC